MKVFIDFDDVIFNTKKFSGDLKSFFQSHGVSEELFTKHYYSENLETMKVFDPWGLMTRLQDVEGINTEKMKDSFEEQLRDLFQYLFDDVEMFLKSVGKENAYLISYGLPAMQNKKIIGSNIDILVEKYVVVENLKANAIARIIDDENISTEEDLFFIDDRMQQIEDVKKMFPNMHTMLLCRKEGRYCDQKNEYCDYEIHDLREAQEIISNFFLS